MKKRRCLKYGRLCRFCFVARWRSRVCVIRRNKLTLLYYQLVVSEWPLPSAVGKELCDWLALSSVLLEEWGGVTPAIHLSSCCSVFGFGLLSWPHWVRNWIFSPVTGTKGVPGQHLKGSFTASDYSSALRSLNNSASALGCISRWRINSVSFCFLCLLLNHHWRRQPWNSWSQGSMWVPPPEQKYMCIDWKLISKRIF